MALLAEYSCKATPARRVVEVYDADAYLGDDDAMAAARRQVVAGNGYHLYLRSLQPDIDVEVTIRIWDTPPTPPADAEDHVPVSIESETGTLVVNQLEYGPAGEMSLPHPGIYEGHAWWENRQATADYYTVTLDHPTDHSFEDHLAQAWNSCPVSERYVLDSPTPAHRSPSTTRNSDHAASGRSPTAPRTAGRTDRPRRSYRPSRGRRRMSSTATGE